MKKLNLLFIALLIYVSISCLNETKPKTSVNMEINKEEYNDSLHFADLYENAKMKYAFKGSSKSDFNEWQQNFRTELRNLLGLSKMEIAYKEYKVQAEKVAEEDIEFAIREHWYIWTEPTVRLPFILLRPKSINTSVPLVICPHGHSKNTELYAGIYNTEEERISGEEGERDVAIQAVKEGYIAIAPTTRGFGETRNAKGKLDDERSSCRDLLVHDLLVGRTPIGDRVWDMSRIIDWALATLPVDQKNIIITGNSGGGTVSLFTAACEPRISIAVPSSYFCTFTGSIGSIHHCECNYVPGILQLGEMADVAGLVAPRPFCAVQGKLDKIFPIEESRKAFAHLKEIYKAAGVPDDCELYEGPEGHRYYKDGVWPFVKKHLKN